MSDTITDRILRAVASQRDEMVTFTRALVAVPTENPPGRSYLACVETMARKLREMGMDPEVVEVPESLPSGRGTLTRGSQSHPRFCLLSFYGSAPRTLYFHGHYDVVPAAREAQFRPHVKGGNLFGRGSADMKGGLTAMIYAVKALHDAEIPIDGRIGLIIVPDEETGGKSGSRYLADQGLLGTNGIGMLTPEPTSGLIWNATRGAISLRVTVRGKPAHVGLSYQGINAFEQMIAIAGRLRELKREVESRKTSYKISPDAARSSILLLGGRCEGGTNFNTVPESCSFTIDRRINPEEDLDEERGRLFEILDHARRDGIELEVEVLQEGRSAGFTEDEPVAQALAESIQKIRDKPADFEMCPGLLEIRFYAERNIPAFAHGPGLLSVSHGPNEFLKLEDLYACAAVYARTAARLLAPHE